MSRLRAGEVREPCGCVHNGIEWLELCGPDSAQGPNLDHHGEWDRAHAQAQADHAAKREVAP